MKRLALALSLVCALGCTATLTPEQERVRVTNDPVRAQGCRFVGNVTGESQWEDEAFREVQRHAAKLGADTVVITFTTPSGRQQRGEAFKCEAPQ